jgi:hypothetical protein
MSRDPKQVALARAAEHGTPYVHRDGPFVVLVLSATRNTATRQLTGEAYTRMCSSAAIARVVAASALTNLQQFPERDPLAVSALYAEATYRHACRRARRAA